MKILAGILALGICGTGLVVSACGVSNSKELSTPPERTPWPVMPIGDYQVRVSDPTQPPQILYEDVTSQDGGVLRWGEPANKEDGLVYFERRIEASDPEADENVLPWDMKRVGKRPQDG